MEVGGGDKSSSKDEDSGSDKPLKKARYAWEVKGKYYLKEKGQRESCGETSNALTKQVCIYLKKVRWQSPAR